MASMSVVVSKIFNKRIFYSILGFCLDQFPPLNETRVDGFEWPW